MIVGGSGFIGYNLIDSLLEANYDICVVDKKTSDYSNLTNLSFSVKTYQIDIKKSIDYVFEIEKPEIVYYLIDSMTDDIVDSIKLDILGFVNVLKLSVKYKVHKVIFVSNFDVSYDDCATCSHRNRYDLPHLQLDELHKYMAEMYLQYFKTEYNLEYVSLRSSIVYGYKEFDNWSDNIIDTLIKNSFKNKNVVFDVQKDTYINLLYIGDLISAMIHSLRDDISGIYNIYDQYYTYEEIVEKVEQRISRKVNVIWGDKNKKMKKLDRLEINSLINFGWQPLVDINAGIYSVCKKFFKNFSI